MTLSKYSFTSNNAFEYLFSDEKELDKILQQKTNNSLKKFDDENESSLMSSLDSSEQEWEDLDLDFPNALTKENDSEKEQTFETTIEEKITIKSTKKRRNGITKNDRKLRLEIHKLHLLCLISHASLRNRFCRDKRIHAKLKSVLPDKVKQLFNPDEQISQYQKSKMFMSALKASVGIWKRKFKKNKYGLSKSLWVNSEQINKIKTEKSYDNIFCFKDFLKAAEQLQGSRDLGAQLFVALLHCNNVNARLTIFLQPLSYNFDKSNSLNNVAPNTFTQNNDIIEFKNDHVDENKMESVRAFKRPKFNHLVTNNRFSENSDIIKESLHPVYWVEALNPSTQKWIFVDPMVSYLIGKPSKMDSLVSRSRNSLSYVISLDKSGYIKDVTRRYTKYFNSKVRKQRIESVSGGEEWWERVLNFYKLGYVAQSFDLLEDEEFLERQTYEKMPQSIKDLKDHPLFIMKRHLKREQIILSEKPYSFITVKKDGKQVKEPVFHRKDIVIVLSASKWYQRGRIIKFGEQPMKIVPKYKESVFENNLNNNIKPDTIGLYSESQTELYIPPPIINGKVPRNSYGNLDIFVPSMIPKGAVYLPFSGISQAAKILCVDYADAVIGFKFKKKLSLPIIKGIIIAQEFEEAVYLTFKIMEEEKNEIISQKMKNIILKRWRRFYKKLCICESRQNTGYRMILPLGKFPTCKSLSSINFRRYLSGCNVLKNENLKKTTHFGFKEILESQKENLVQNVFTSVSSSYDKMNDIMSMGIHRLWKDEFVQRLDPGSLNGEPMDILDVAGGTGDIAFRLLDHATDIHFDTQTRVKCVDLNPNMIEIGKKRLENSRYRYSKRINFFIQNAGNLKDIPSLSINIYTIAFGIRNCTRIMDVLKEAYRVLKPGGVFSCLEFSKISLAPLASIYDYYRFNIIPIMGQIVVGDRDSYQYLAESISKHPDQKTFSRMMEDVGFKLVGDGYHNLSFGIAAIHTGIKL
ncbi:hypothetical protein PCK1_002761 [Pneumocystis canis]|nr:hypothetical protein PCK1_002761 [Pneumocystis canis]